MQQLRLRDGRRARKMYRVGVGAIVERGAWNVRAPGMQVVICLSAVDRDGSAVYFSRAS